MVNALGGDAWSKPDQQQQEGHDTKITAQELKFALEKNSCRILKETPTIVHLQADSLVSRMLMLPFHQPCS